MIKLTKMHQGEEVWVNWSLVRTMYRSSAPKGSCICMFTFDDDDMIRVRESVEEILALVEGKTMEEEEKCSACDRGECELFTCSGCGKQFCEEHLADDEDTCIPCVKGRKNNG